MTKQKAKEVFNLLKKHYPHAKMILQWSNNWELLVSIILSAQCTDKKVNEVTSRLFPKYSNTWERFEPTYKKYENLTSLPSYQVVEIVNFAYVPISKLEADIKPTGFYHNKAKNVQAAAIKILTDFNGILPKTIESLITIPGVGRKTANVFLGNAYHIYEGIAVDTHVMKQSQLFGFTKEKTPEKIEKDLMKLFDKKDWFTLTYLLIEHGRNMRKKRQDRTSCNNPTCLLSI